MYSQIKYILTNKNKYMMKFDFETIIILLIINESFELCLISVIYIYIYINMFY
jgi:hypothetical protein